METKIIHFMLQGKGGVGKTTIANWFAQFRMRRVPELRVIDLDPVNNSISEFAELNAEKVDLMSGDEMNPRKFDDIMEKILSSPDEFLLDTGSSAFVPLSSYLIENNAIERLIDSGRTVIVHIVLAGSQSLAQTLNGFESVVSYFNPAVRVIVWLNEYFGPILIADLEFEELEIYKTHKERVIGIIRVPRKNEKTFVADLRSMLAENLTFDQAIESPAFQLMARQRLGMYRDLIFNQLKELEYD